jgi:hypothetical protein
MVQDILWKVHSYSDCQRIACFHYGTQRFITVFTKTHHWTLSWASWIQFAPTTPISLRSILMLFSHLCLGPVSTCPYACYMSYPPHPPWFNHPNSIRWRIQAMKFIIIHFFSFLLGPYIFFNTLFWNTCSLCSSLKVTDKVSHSYSISGRITVLYISIFSFLYEMGR